MKHMEIGLSLGSNLGDRLLNLREARKRMLATGGISLAACSPVYETEPVGVAPYNREWYFLNAVLVVKTTLSLSVLAKCFKAIEREIGRDPIHQLNAPRLIDIDVIYAGDLCVHKDGMIIPHPRWSQRRFVVQPLNDVRSDLVVPGQSGPVRDVFKKLSDKHKIKLFEKEW